MLYEAFDCSHADIAAVLGTRAANARQRLRDNMDKTREEKLCRALVRRFQAAINGMDVAAVTTLLLDEQPMSVGSTPQVRAARGPCANDAVYRVAAFA